MPAPPPGASLDPQNPSLLGSGRRQLFEMLNRPIVFETPLRVVHPPSWLEHIPFAYWMVDVLRPAVFIELGTHSGNSYSAFAQAIRALGLTTAAYAVDTWEGDSQAGFYDEGVYTEWAAFHDRHFSAFSRLVRASFEEAAQHFPDGSVDLLHLDGCHIYEAIASDFALWRPKLSDRGVILFHDINIRERDFGAWRLWEDVKSEHTATFEFLHGHGLGVLGVGSHLPDALRWLLSRASESPRDVHDIRRFFARLGGAISAGFTAAQAEQEAREAPEAPRGAGVRRGDREPSLIEQLDAARAALVDRDRQIAEQAALLAEQAALLTEQARAIEQSDSELSALDDELAHREELLSIAGEQLDEWRTRQDRQLQLIEALRQSQHPLARRADEDGGAVSLRTSRLAPQLPPRARATLRGRVLQLRDMLRTPAALGVVPSARHGWRPSGLRFLLQPRTFSIAHRILGSGLFDEAYYAGCNRDVTTSRLSPLSHYVTRGALEGRKPHPLFDGSYYFRSNPDVAEAGANPLIHYLVSGAAEGRNPHPLFDVNYYTAANPDVRAAGFEPLNHFLRFGAAEGRRPNPFFDCAYYLRHNPDVAASGINPLVHFATDGWKEGRRPSPAFDVLAYLAEYPDVVATGRNPLEHYLEYGRAEGRPLPGVIDVEGAAVSPLPELAGVPLAVTPLQPRPPQPTILCLSHVMPFPPRAGNEYRIYRMLCWLRDRGYRIVPVIAPLPGDQVDSDAVRTLAAKFTNAVLCDRDGRVEYVLGDVPDVLGSLAGELTRPVSLLLDEQQVRSEHERQLLQMDRAFCHDVLITVTSRLQQALGPHILLAEYIWMSRILPLVKGDVLKVIDTIDVFSTKRDKVLRFGIDDLHVEETEEAKRLQHADLVIAIQDDERQQLQRLLPDKAVVTAGVDYDVVADPGMPAGRRILLVASGNPMNRKGLADFLRFAWPQVQREVPDAELVVIGKVGEVIPVDIPGIVRLGHVADLTPHYEAARVVINPAVAGTGLKIKTLEALGHLRPVVTWPSGTDGVPAELAALCEIVHDWYDFARRVSRLLSTPEPRLFSASERETIVRLTAPETVYAGITDALDALVKERFGVDRDTSSPQNAAHA